MTRSPSSTLLSNLLSPSSGAMLCPSLGHTCHMVQVWTNSIVLYDLYVFLWLCRLVFIIIVIIVVVIVIVIIIIIVVVIVIVIIIIIIIIILYICI